MLYSTSLGGGDVIYFASTSSVGGRFLASEMQKLVIFASTSSIGDALIEIIQNMIKVFGNQHAKWYNILHMT